MSLGVGTKLTSYMQKFQICKLCDITKVSFNANTKNMYHNKSLKLVVMATCNG